VTWPLTRTNEDARDEEDGRGRVVADYGSSGPRSAAVILAEAPMPGAAFAYVRQVPPGGGIPGAIYPVVLDPLAHGEHLEPSSVKPTGGDSSHG
jgi:hypothetical protein